MFLIIYFLIIFLILLNRTSLYLFGGDSSEFSLVGSTWGVAHPPGYPLYSLLSNLIVRIFPFFTVPWRISLMSSISTVLTSILIYKILRFYKIHRNVSFFSAGFYVFLYPVWLYSLVPEVFALHTLLVTLTTWFVFQFTKRKKISYLYFIFLLLGLQISNHHMFLLFVPGWTYLLHKSRVTLFLKKLSKRNIILLVCLFLIGVSFYLYTPIVSYFGAISDWENAKTLLGFVRLITRATYGSFKAYLGSVPNFINQFFDLVTCFIFIFHDFRILGLIFIIYGLFTLIKNYKILFNFIFISLTSHVFFYYYSNFTLSRPFAIALFERFLIPFYLLLIIPFSFGLNNIQIKIFEFTNLYIKNSKLKKLIPYVFHLFLGVLLLLFATQNYKTIKYIKNLSIFNTYAKDILKTPPKNALIQVKYDNSYFPSSYMYYAEHVRTDLQFIFFALLPRPNYQQLLKKLYPNLYIPKKFDQTVNKTIDFLNRNNTNGVYFETKVATDSWRPYGLLWKYYKNSEEIQKDQQNLLNANRELWDKVYTIPSLNSDQKNILHFVDVQDSYINSYIEYSKLLVETNHITEAEQVIKEIFTQYRKTDLVTKTILINILVEQNKCKEASLYVNTVPYEKMSQSTNILQSYSSYFSKCDPKNPQKKAIDKQLFEINSNSEKIKQQI